MSVFCDRSEGSTCAAQCDYGYVARNNSMQVTCLSSGQWNPNPSNLCQKNTLCPAYVANGWISSTCSRRVSETCSIICNLGYTLTLPGMTATCLSSGRWDADLSNVCVYENSVCPAFVSNGWISSTCSRHIGDICSVNCNLGYTLTLPGMSTTCLFTGEWDTDLSTVCVLQNRDSSSSESEAPASSNIIIPLTLAVAAVTTIIVGIIVVCFRCQRGCNGNRSPRDETSSSSHISTMYSVGQCRMGSNLNLLSGSQTSIQAHDVSPPPYAEVMKNNPANLGPPPSYEEVNASPSRFLPDSYI
ncbi:hypothetical protein ACJMK2_017063 [Sinanodonta woodiana]|uniref:Sushi domain-containing protein n=1 Tax=Sinanodonta woodiana TaxID=1069815 RepID=A0ABD3UYV7_SINWO